jgi:hypothetical protein
MEKALYYIMSPRCEIPVGGPADMPCNYQNGYGVFCIDKLTMKESMMNMTKKTIVYGMGGAFLALALIMGACEQPTSESGGDGYFGDDGNLDLTEDVHKNVPPDYEDLVTENGDVLFNGVKVGTITDGEMDISIPKPATLSSEVSGLLAGTLASTGVKFDSIVATPTGAKYVEVKLTVNTKPLSNEIIKSGEAEYVRYIYVSENVTIEASGKEFTILGTSRPGGSGSGDATLTADEDFSLELKKGWNALYERYDLSDDDASYSLEIGDHSNKFQNFVLKS